MYVLILPGFMIQVMAIATTGLWFILLKEVIRLLEEVLMKLYEPRKDHGNRLYSWHAIIFFSYNCKHDVLTNIGICGMVYLCLRHDVFVF